ncbi:MAG: hypothetical protein ACSLE0_19810 [Chitinophagaceae bacterium]
MTPELKIACELIFQEHKTSAHPVAWKRDAFRGRISTGLCEMGKETLLKKNIIYYPNPAKKVLTKLNPGAFDAENFEEAENIVLHKKPELSTANSKEIRTPAIASKKIPVAPKHEPVFIRRPATYQLSAFTGKTQSITNDTKWYMLPVFMYFIWPICAAFIFGLLAFLLGNIYTALFFDIK